MYLLVFDEALDILDIEVGGYVDLDVICKYFKKYYGTIIECFNYWKKSFNFGFVRSDGIWRSR